MSYTKKTYTAKSLISVNVDVSELRTATIVFEALTSGGSQFITTDEELQQALENDYNYNKLYKLTSSESVDEAVTEPKVKYGNKKEYTTIAEESNARRRADAMIIGFAFAATEYDSTNSVIKFYNKLGHVVATLPAEPFITDGMIDSVAVVGTNLVITFNTASGKQPITIPLDQLNYPVITQEEMDAVLTPDEDDDNNDNEEQSEV